eukprot:GGOE01063447.1.p2 GENE.GGOE01063447.1~~GGOE01063447.1.p2  ORF type:complete len:193 (+),score=11.22 GGOE01063447.1:520-1098(+)
MEAEREPPISPHTPTCPFRRRSADFAVVFCRLTTFGGLADPQMTPGWPHGSPLALRASPRSCNDNDPCIASFLHCGHPVNSSTGSLLPFGSFCPSCSWSRGARVPFGSADSLAVACISALPHRASTVSPPLPPWPPGLSSHDALACKPVDKSHQICGFVLPNRCGDMVGYQQRYSAPPQLQPDHQLSANYDT